MKTLIKSQAKLNIAISPNRLHLKNDKGFNIQTTGESKPYQILFYLLFILSIFFIFPESPLESDYLCNKYHSHDACNIW
tara:strand:- start:81 stop:317 length:237 start_codon:yes stop_codon:yes gene_type:complete